MVGAFLVLAAAGTLASPITIGDLLAVTDIAALTVSPDGQTVAFRTEQPSLTRNRIETRWWAVPVDGHRPARPLADGGEAAIGDAGVVAPERASWSVDGRHLLIRSTGVGGLQVRAIDVVTSTVRTVTDAIGDVGAFEISADGNAVDYAEGPPRTLIRTTEQRLHDQGALVDDSVDLAVGVVGGSWALGQPQSVRRTGDWFDRRGLLDGQGSRGWRQPLAGGKAKQLATAPQWPVYVAPDATLAAQICARLDCGAEQIDAITPVPSLHATLVTTHDAGLRQTLRLFDGGSLHAIAIGDGLLSGSRQQSDPCAIAGTRAICVLAAADNPPRLAAVALATGQILNLFAPNHALAIRTRGIARRFAWQDAAGRAFTGQLFIPRGDRPVAGFPLVIQYYWCDGFLRGGQGDELPMAPLAANGIAILCINKRPLGQPTPNSIADYRLAADGIAAAIEQLSAQGLIDRRKIGMQGLSFGSQVTMWVASETRLLRAAAVASGQVEPVSYWYGARPSNDFAARLKEGWGLDDPDRDPARWQAMTAARRAAQIHVALLMQLPESEARWSIELFAKLRRSPTPVELYAFPDAAHVKALPRQKAAAYERNLAWFRFWLKGEIQIDAEDPSRAARWATLAARALQASESSQNSASTSSSNRM